MRGVTFQCLFYGSLIFGIWTALLYVYIHHNHVSNLEKKNQGPALIWSHEKKLQQQIPRDPKQIPRLRVRFEMPDKYETTEYKTFLRSGKDTNYSKPEYIAGFLKYGFNAILSKSLGSERDVPDTRNKMCLQKHYPANLPTASVVICFYNEEFNALFRTMSSVINLTPHYLLEEIVLVDDMSDFDDLKEKLDHRLEIFRGKIKLIRNKQREGLIRSRLIGAARASGDVLVFLDSHCEVNRVWLQPLLHTIAKDPRMVVCPLIDPIDHETLEYRPSPAVRGAFNWHLEFKWDNVFSYEMDGPEGPTRPIRSPAMAGGVFAINRHYFNEIGQYDRDMKLSGAENLELSLREQFFLRQPGLKSVAYGNISERVELRKRLGCKPFQWYLDNVFPELETSKDSQRKGNKSFSLMKD
ncbi:inactive polypeptide N-acetylgalactosaminyltransferase-like protein 5 isoform X3 [Mustela putorius furo]|uniref:Inactive polypeptide N-acetylgalactosaminyltransferase-like protein 5 isoform X3 n=1 Tax=Mustela putorius furo TaxID=9669 RepID=A0A8U0SJ45_MUSPF|nr:inactive polypeptide N-acetylgalactosaminyltransferase-like protein 5 isoform X3 [Mustela putorius furo]